MYKPGDMVICIREPDLSPSHRYFDQLGKTYRVIRWESYDTGSGILELEGIGTGWFAERFKKIGPKHKNKPDRGE